ncbi:MAG: hypothetical protein JSS49_09335 [Planctomycetes bacterium]|nr:hypothetical protein [Planctomycetota bacterium]
MMTELSQRTRDRHPSVPRLLVSVRSRLEAISAVEGGAEILDVKEPSHGSLGMAGIHEIEEIADFIANQDQFTGGTAVPLSVALGELRDWSGSNCVPALPAAVTFAKLGLSGLARVRDWQRTWRQVRDDFDRQRIAPLRWVAVAYVDEESAASPPLDSIVSAARNGCAGLLVDTYSKTGKSLIDFAAGPVLKELARQCHDSGLFLAIAGSLTMDAVVQLADVEADIVAIRSAACPRANRCDSVDASLVAAFRDALLQRQSKPQATGAP